MKKLEKIKPMLPSLREKKRYLAFEIISRNRIHGFSAVNKAVWDSCLAFLGELGVSKAGIIVLGDKWSPDRQRGIIRVDRKYIDHTKVALALIKKIDGEKVIVRSVGVSGMINKADKKYLGQCGVQ